MRPARRVRRQGVAETSTLASSGFRIPENLIAAHPEPSLGALQQRAYFRDTIGSDGIPEMTYKHPRLQGLDESDLLSEDLRELHDRITKELHRRGGFDVLRTRQQLDSEVDAMMAAATLGVP